jgi:hypothetical protein
VIEQRDVRRIHLAVVAHIILASALVVVLAMPYRQFPFSIGQAWAAVVVVPAAAVWFGLWRARRSREQSAAMRQMLLVPLWIAVATLAAFFELIAQVSRN